MMESMIIRDSNYGQGFTPVRRRLSTIKIRQPHNDLEKEWTAARCNRLLRALKSRLAILNKGISRIQSGGQGRDKSSESYARTTRKVDQDIDWPQARKKVRRTYSTRNGRGDTGSRGGSRGGTRTISTSKDVRSFIPGEVLVPTPILNRARGEIVSGPSSTILYFEAGEQETKTKKRTRAHESQVNARPSDTLRDFRRQTSATRYTIYEGIYNGLETLLKATSPDEPPKKTNGPRSLLTMCLNIVPRYITQEEELFAAHVEATGSKSSISNRDISTEIYDDLEAFGSNGRGWKHLRDIVRSHGIQVVSDAVQADSLDAEFVAILITLCIHTSATHEAETLLSALLSRSTFPAPKSVFARFGDEPATRSLSVLWKFVEITSSFPFQYRQLSILIADGLLPLGWLASREFGPVWTRTIQACSHDSTSTDALKFMDVALPLLAQSGGLGGEEYGLMAGDSVMIAATKQTFSSLLTTLLSIVILSINSASQIQDQESALGIPKYGDFVTLMRSCLMQWKRSRSFSLNSQGTLLVIANIILHKVGQNSFGSDFDLIDILFNHLRQMSRSSNPLPSYHDVVTFICSIARCCGRGASNSGFDQLENLHQILESLDYERDTDRGDILFEIIADSALAFAQEAPDSKHLNYAITMEGRVHQLAAKPRVSLTPGNTMDSSRSGFRWEEGISEWVTATPIMSNSKGKDSTAFFVGDQFESETPFRPLLRRNTKKQALSHMSAPALRSSGLSISRAANSEPIISSELRRSTASGLQQDSDGESVESMSPENDSIDAGQFENDLVMNELSETDFASDVDGSGDELAIKPMEEEQINVSGNSWDEVHSSSPQSHSSNSSENSLSSSPQIDDPEDSLDNKSFASIASSAVSHKSSELGSGRRYIDRVPRLSRRILRGSLQWQLFDDSDDELSFMSVSSEGGSILEDITKRAGPRTRWQRHRKVTAKVPKPITGFGDSLLGGSEDELGV